jgi:hypothetical protein
MVESIACVVEGQGEVAALPVLIRRIAHELADRTVLTPRPLRLSRPKFRVPQELDRFVELAAAKAQPSGAVLVVADSDEDDPQEFAEVCLSCVTRFELPIAIVVPTRQYESWFLAGASSLEGKRGLKSPLAPPRDPELVPNPKRWLEDRHTLNSGPQRKWCYSETTDQPALTGLMNLEEARALSPSLDECIRQVLNLLNT